MENKPFIFGVATSGDNFTDREKETERLLLNFQHGVNTCLLYTSDAADDATWV